MARGKKRPLIEEKSEEDSQVGQEQQPQPASSVTASPFTIIYRAPKKGRRSSKTARGGAENATTDIEENPLGDGVDMVYSIRPQNAWAALKRFRNFMVGEETFTIHQYVYVNHSGIAHGEELSDAHPKMFWIARVLEIKAIDPEHVYLRVFWLYWPDELPDGAQPYHGKNELVASNHMEILDAMTVTGRAEVQHWREDDEEEVPSELFWRQTYDCQTHQLSILRKHCTCKGYYNPDGMLVNCSNADCRIWLHKECILKDVLSRVHSRVVGEETVEVGKTSRKSRKSNPSTTTNTMQAPGSDPWEGLFDAKLVNKGGRHKVVVTDLRGGGSSNPSPKASRQSQGKAWEEEIHCLRCKEKIV